MLGVFHPQNAQNGSGGGPEYGEMYQQGAAVAYNQEGNDYALLDGQHFQVQTDSRVASLPSAGAPLRVAYSATATPGYYLMLGYFTYV